MYDQGREGGAGMSWRYSPPAIEDYDSIEEYEEAMSLYESAEDDYAESYHERIRESR